MHRNTTTFIVLLGVFAAVVTGVNLARMGPSSPDEVTIKSSPIPTTTPLPIVMTKYTDSVCNVSFALPQTETYESLKAGGGSVVSTVNQEELIKLSCSRTKTKLTNPELFENILVGSIAAFIVTKAEDATSSAIVNRTLILNHPYTNREIRLLGERTLITEVANNLEFIKPETN